MGYLVKITTMNGTHKIVEKAGCRGERTYISIENETKIRINPKPRKLTGWKTIKGAEKYIENDKKNVLGSEWTSEYEIIIKL